MGTNFYRIPPEKEMIKRRTALVKKVNQMKITPELINDGFTFIIPDGVSKNENGYAYVSAISPWDEFMYGIKIHLGKRSMGWKFLWNFHNNKYFSNKDELFDFIRNGRVIDEYGVLINQKKFIEMALEWGQPNGRIYGTKEDIEQYRDEYDMVMSYTKVEPDMIIDGLVVSRYINFS